MKIEREAMQRRKRAFAVAWATPGRYTYRNGPEAYREAVGPDEPMTADACRKGARRYLADPEVQAEIARVQEASATHAGLSIETFVFECLENEERLLALTEMKGGGGKGSAMAAVKYRELAAQALGYLDKGGRGAEAGEEPAPAVPRTRDELLRIKAAVDTMLEISQPMPLPGEVTVEVDDGPDES